MALTVDEILRKIGEFRLYQWLILGVIGYGSFAISAFSVMVVSFITAEPDWKCVKGYKNNSVCNFTEAITLTSDNYKARCDMPREAWTYVQGFTSTVTEVTFQRAVPLFVVNIANYVAKLRTLLRNLRSQLPKLLNKSILLSIAQSCYWIGMLLGLLLGGYLSDRFGRRKILYFGFVLVTVATWIMVFPKEFIVFVVARVVIGIGSGFRNATSFILLSEYTTEKYRALIGIGSFYFWVLGLVTLPLIAYLVREWRYVLLVTAVFAVPCLFTWWFIPESPRWLLLHGKENKARQRLTKVAKINKRPMPNDDLAKPEINERKGSFRYLFLNGKVTRTTLISCDLWFAISLVYYGVSYGSVDLGGNRYLNVFLTSIIEFPSNFAAIWSVNRFGRKKSVVTALLIAFIAAAISVSIPTERSSSANNGGRIFVAVVAKFFINFAFSGVYVWSAELFPTFIRSTGLGVSSAAARLGSFSASYIIWLIRIHALLPYGLMGLICLQAAILGLFLPETKSQATLETMDDMINRADRGLPSDLVTYRPESNAGESETVSLGDEKS